MELLLKLSTNAWFILVVVSVNLLDCSAVEDFPQLDYVKTKYVCQNDSVNLICPSPSLLEIQAVSFGRAMRAVCASGRNAHKSCDLMDKKLIVKQFCDFKPECKFVANVDKFGNDCPDVDKYLNVIYACVRNPDVEYSKTKLTTREPPTSQQTQPSIKTALPITSNVTQSPNITGNVTAKLVTTPKQSKKQPNLPQTKVRVFNPNDPDLEFLAKAGENSIYQGPKNIYLMVVTGGGTLAFLLQWFW